MMHLIESRKDQYIIMDDRGDINTIPKTVYNQVKIEGFNGNRILYKMDAEHEITETYDNGIFNCRIAKAIMQLDNRDEIAAAILAHKATGKTILYDQLFAAAFSKQNRVYLLKHVLGAYADRLKITDRYVEIDDGMFRVDNNAAAYVKDAGHKSGYNYLCIVVKPGALIGMTSIKTALGTFEIDVTGLELIAKVLFLLNPNPEDRVFMQQLSSAVKDHVWQIAGKTDLTLWDA